MMITRVTCEILRPIPVGDITVAARVARPGHRVELLEATATAGGREVARATAWRVLRTSAPAVPPAQASPPPLPGQAPAGPPGWGDSGYMSAIEWRGARGSFHSPGPAALWTRMRYPLVPGEEPAPLDRVLVSADSGSGASWELDFSGWLFINPELTVHLHREPAGEWICLDAQTTITPGGAGLATSALSDLDGPVGVAAQSLFITPRQAPPAENRLAWPGRRRTGASCPGNQPAGAVPGP